MNRAWREPGEPSPNRPPAKELNIRKRIVPALCLVSLLIPMSGCPGALGPQILLGNWIYFIEMTNLYAGIAFLADGEMEEFQSGPQPLGTATVFSGVMTWVQQGRELTIVQDLGGSSFTFRATVEQSGFLQGTRTFSANPNSVEMFTAVKAPSELVF